MLRVLSLALALSLAAWAQMLPGVIDIHAHSDPDAANRSIDSLALARLAKERGMRAIVLKNHYESTASQAYLVRKAVPGIEVFGGIALNRSVGGVNPAAIDQMTKIDGGWGRVVWMPTYDSEHHVRGQGESRPFVPVSKNGQLLPEVIEVIGLVARTGLVLATGHSSPAESLLLIEEAKRQGVRAIVVTHPTQQFVRMPVEVMKQAAEMGAYLEFVRVANAAETARVIREVGPEHCILSSDLGQAGNPLHPDGLANFFQDLMRNGITAAEIDRMSQRNPATLLGLVP